MSSPKSTVCDLAKKSVFTSVTLIITLLFILTFPLLILILSPVFIFRFAVFYLAKWFQPNLGKMLCARSSLMTLGSVYKDPKNTLVLPVLVEGVPDIDKVRSIMENNLINAISPSSSVSNSEALFPEMKQNLVYWMGFLFWKPLRKAFRIEEHVYNYKEDGTSKSSMDIEDVSKFVMDLTAKSWSTDKALWEMIVIPNVIPWSSSGANQQSVFVLRFHHGLGDGYSVLKFFSRIDQSGGIAKILNPRLKADEKSKNGRSLLQNLEIMLKVPYDLAKASLQFPEKTVWKVNNKEFQGHCCGAISNTISLKDFKGTKNRLGASFTALLISLVVGGIRNVMIKQGGKLPKKMTFRFPLPLPGHSEKLRNYATFGYILIDLQEQDALQRLDQIQKQFSKLRKSTVPLTMSFLCVLGGSLFPWMISLLQKNSLKSHAVVLSNFPGPEDPSDVCGHLVKNLYFTSSVAGTGAMAFGATTYMDDINISIGADGAILPTNKSAQELVSEILKEFEIFKSISKPLVV